MRNLFRALWERHKLGYIFIGALLFGIAVAFKSGGGFVVILVLRTSSDRPGVVGQLNRA